MVPMLNFWGHLNGLFWNTSSYATSTVCHIWHLFIWEVYGPNFLQKHDKVQHWSTDYSHIGHSGTTEKDSVPCDGSLWSLRLVFFGLALSSGSGGGLNVKKKKMPYKGTAMHSSLSTSADARETFDRVFFYGAWWWYLFLFLAFIFEKGRLLCLSKMLFIFRLFIFVHGKPYRAYKEKIS